MTESALNSDVPKRAQPTEAPEKIGVAGIYDPKWIFVALCYIAAHAEASRIWANELIEIGSIEDPPIIYAYKVNLQWERNRGLLIGKNYHPEWIKSIRR